MAGSIDIGHAEIATHLLGDGFHAAPVEIRLQAMLADEVLPRVAERLEHEIGAETILCLPELPLLVQMTLTEALTQTGVTLWSDAMFCAIQARIASGEDVWAFENRWAFLAAYLHDRLDLTRHPEHVFSGLSTLDLLSPGQAICEAVRVWPRIWHWLGQGGPKDHAAFVTALRQREGPPFLRTLVLTALETAVSREVSPQPDLLDRLGDTASLRDLLPALSQSDLTAPDAVVSTALSVALAKLGQAPETASAREAMKVGLVLALLQTICCDASVALPPVSWSVACELRAQSLPDRIRTACQPWLTPLLQSEAAEGLLASLAAQIIEGAVTEKTAKRAETQQPLPAEARDLSTAPKQRADAQMITSPIAGVALCLPFFTENRIGQATPAALRLAALAALGADGPVEHPQNDPLLRALAGMDTREDFSTRPDEMDLLFVPEDKRSRIMEAPSGAARFALWLEARFAASLPGLSAASHGFLQTQFFHRPGRLLRDENNLVIDIDAPPLRAVLDLSGLIGPASGRATWLNGEEIVLRLREVSS